MGASATETELELLVVGLDGCCRSVLGPLFEAGEIPTIERLIDVPIDAEMDGTALPVVDAGKETTYPDYEPEPIRATDDGAVEDHLSDRGYL